MLKPRIQRSLSVAVEPMRITASAFRQLRAVLTSGPPERGLVLLGRPQDGIIRQVYYDVSARTDGASYSPDVDSLHRLIAECWKGAGLEILGFAHSHPGRYDRLSPADVSYAQQLLAGNPHLRRLVLPVATLESGFQLHPFAASQGRSGVRIERIPVELHDERVVATRPDAETQAQVREWVHSRRWARPRWVARLLAPRRQWWRGEEYARVQGAYDVDRLAHSTVVAVGLGGGRGLLEDLARTGIGRFVLIDFDRVARPNIASQYCTSCEIGEQKVRAVRRRLREINRHVVVETRAVRVEELSVEEVARLIGLGEGGDPSSVLLLAMTDSFAAQAHMNRLALHLGVPLLAAQMYADGAGGELVFTHPAATPYCLRCRLKERYEAYADGFENDVTSVGSPIFSASRLNAIAGYLAMALLHHATAHPRWGHLLEAIADRNLVQVRMHPDLPLPAFDAILGRHPRCVHADEAIWLPLHPRPGRGECPECGSTGDLRDAIGKHPAVSVKE